MPTPRFITDDDRDSVQAEIASHNHDLHFNWSDSFLSAIHLYCDRYPFTGDESLGLLEDIDDAIEEESELEEEEEEEEAAWNVPGLD